MSTVLGQILVVDHEGTTVASLQENLPKLGYRLAGVASTGREAVELAERFPLDLLLVNLQLQGDLDGIATAGEIVRRRQVPVVYTATHADEETCGRARAGGPFGLLIKPFELQELHAVLLLALMRQQTLEEAFENQVLFETMLKTTQEGVITADAGGHVRLMSPAAEDTTGWMQAQARGRPIEEVYPLLDLDRRPVEHPLRRALGTGVAQEKTRFVLAGRYGREVLVEDAAAPLRNVRGEISGALITVCDVTERIRVDEFRMKEREKLKEQVAQTAEALDATRAELRGVIGRGITVMEEERRRVARELHDDLGQRIAFLQFEAERLQEQATAPEVQSGLTRLIEEAAKFSSTLRELSHRLHPSMLEDLGLAAALRSLVEDYRNQGMDVTLSAGEVSSSVSLDACTNLYRIAQEALRNAWKHAPGAAVSIRLLEEDGQVQLTIEDTGPGFDVGKAREQGGLGVLSMQERARFVGGNIFLSSHPEGGTRLVVRIPVRV